MIWKRGRLAALWAAGLTLAGAAVAAAQDGATARYAGVARAWPRGEKALIRLQVSGADQAAVDVSGWLARTVPVKDGLAEIELDTNLLRAGDYDLRARLLRGGAQAGEAVFPVAIGRPHDTERMPIWRWGGGGGDLGLLMQFGYTGAWLSSMQAPEGDRSPAEYASRHASAMNESARLDFDMGLYLHPFLSKALLSVEGSRGTLGNGKPADKVYPLAPPVMDYCRRLARASAEAFAPFPAWRHAMLTSEYHTPMAMHPEAARLAREEAGLDLDKVPLGAGYRGRGEVEVVSGDDLKDGIIADDNPHYRFLKWWWERGHGTAGANAEMAKALKAARPDVITWHEPYRLAPVRNSHAGLDMIGTWTYGWPDIKRLVYTTYLQAAARPAGQKVQQNITLYVYGRTAVALKESTAEFDHDFAGKDPSFTAGPDYAREAMWIVFSQRPDVMAFYAAGALSFEKTSLDPSVYSPETYAAIGETARLLVKPYGPAVLDAQRLRPRVAVLASAVGKWFQPTPKTAGYPCEATLPYATLLMRNQVPFDVLLDDDIIEGKAKEYALLVLPVSGTVTARMAEQLRAFVAGGGKVIANQPFRLDLPGVALTDFDFSHQQRMSGTLYPKHVTADQDREIMEGYASKLSELLKGVDRPVSASSPRVLANGLDGGAARYHFLINDDRTSGPRYGKYQLRHELGVAQTTKVSVAIDGRPALYDALARKAVKYAVEQDRAVFDVTMPAARGKLIVALPEEIGGVAVSAPAQARKGAAVTVKIGVAGKGGKPLAASLPLKVKITDSLGRETEWTRFSTTRRGAGGECVFSFVPALNDVSGVWTVSVEELVSGATTTAEVDVLD